MVFRDVEPAQPVMGDPRRGAHACCCPCRSPSFCLAMALQWPVATTGGYAERQWAHPCTEPTSTQ